MRIRGLTVIAFLALLASACGGTSAASIVDQAPQGTIGGAAWTMRSVVVVDDGTRLQYTLLPDEMTGCDTFASADRMLLFSTPRAVGEYPLFFDLSTLSGQVVNFVTGPGQNVLSSEGLIVVEALSETEVTVGLVADAENNTVNGRFTAAICRE